MTECNAKVLILAKGERCISLKGAKREYYTSDLVMADNGDGTFDVVKNCFGTTGKLVPSGQLRRVPAELKPLPGLTVRAMGLAIVIAVLAGVYWAPPADPNHPLTTVKVLGSFAFCLVFGLACVSGLLLLFRGRF